MSGPIYFSKTDILPSLQGIAYGPRQKWTRLRQRMEERGLILLAVPDHHMKELGWKLYIDQKHYHSPFSSLELNDYQEFKKGRASLHQANIDLNLFFQVDVQISPLQWDRIGEQFYAFIICVSTDEIENKRNQYIQDNLIYLHRVLTNFPFIDLFKSCKNRISRKQPLHDQLVNALWDLFLAWLHTTRSMKRHLPARISIRERAFNFPDPIAFQKQLASSQYLLILVQYMSIEILDFGNSRLLDRYIHNAHDSVKSIIDAQEELIKKIVDKNKQKNHSFLEAGVDLSMQELKNQFINLVEDDLHMLLFQEALVEDATLNVKDHFADSELAAILTRKSDIELWIESMAASRIIDRISYATSRRKSSIWPDLVEVVSPDCRLANRSPETITRFKEAATLILEQEPEVDFFIKEQWQAQFLSLSNFFTQPFFKLTLQNGRLLPQWDLINSKTGEKLLDERATLAERLRERQRELEQNVKRIKRKSPRKKIPVHLGQDGISLEVIGQHNHAVDIQLAVRRQKKTEFGIFDDSRTNADHSEIWLNEMLLIEDEIAPYLMFVKKAFQSALPIRKIVEVNQGRHSTDGVDFDPESIQDTQKWMHGEIMTTLKSTLKKRNAAQINTFVLDASGSMDHPRMRNLYKILVLMVMGLEDRKSFDSFHFFNYNFIEGAKFSEAYTNRRLLFRIMKRIATIDEGKVVYSGNGGTNMGDGIMECHDRLQTFHKYLQKQHTDMVFLKSLFVISDGQPSVGITDPNILNGEINKRRGNNDVAIKGIYLTPPNEKSNDSFMQEIFGENNYVESNNFATAVNELVHIMARTYKLQRQNLKYHKIPLT